MGPFCSRLPCGINEKTTGNTTLVGSGLTKESSDVENAVKGAPCIDYSSRETTIWEAGWKSRDLDWERANGLPREGFPIQTVVHCPNQYAGLTYGQGLSVPRLRAW